MVDLFSGIGGFSLAGKWAGFETVLFVENDKFCRKVIEKNFPGTPIYSDVKKLFFNNKVNLITGGFPCQPFSIAGKQKGKNDERYLWDYFYRIIRMSKPNWVIIENVCGIISMEIDNIIIDMEKENYETSIFVLPACASNAPHRRDRVWIVANLIGIRCDLREYHWQERCIQKNKEWDVASIQQEWQKFQPESWETMQVSDFLSFNTYHGRNDDGISDRMDRLKSLGNAIVPQVIFPIMKFIYKVENDHAIQNSRT